MIHRPVLRKAVSAGWSAGVLMAVLGGIAWVTAWPFIFPSLGPTAYMLALRQASMPARRVIGGHAVGVVCGLLAYGLCAPGVALGDPFAVLAADGLRLAASGTLAVVLTTVGMLLTQTRHAPACATTLIVALGLLSTWWDGVVIVVAVALLWGGDQVLRAYGPTMVRDVQDT